MSDLATVDTQVAPEALQNNNSDSSVEETAQISNQTTEEKGVVEPTKTEKTESTDIAGSNEQTTEISAEESKADVIENSKTEQSLSTEVSESAEDLKVEEKIRVEEIKAVDITEKSEPECVKEEPKIEPIKEETKPEEPKSESVKEEPKSEPVKEPKAEPVKESKPEPVKESTKTEIKEEVKVESKEVEAKKWTSEFSTSNPITNISVNSTASKTTTIASAPVTTPSASSMVDNRSAFSTKAPEPIALAPTKSAVSPTSLSSSNSNVSNYFSSRLNAWETNTQKNPSNVATIAQQRDSRLANYNPPTSFTYSGSNTPRSSYHNPAAGNVPGSMASLLGKSLGVEHQGKSTGLLKPRYDKEEEEARVWHKNRGANQQMSSAFKGVVSETLKKDQASIDNPAQRYLQRRLTENK